MRASEQLLQRTRDFVEDLAAKRRERQERHHLDPADFRRLADIGFLRASVPVAQGGLWDDARPAWLIRQAYDAGLRALERHGRARGETSMAKASIAMLAESLLTRLCRIAGGGACARRSPLGHWFEDVRAMGFLRPPWSLALEGLYALGRDAEPYQAPV